MAATFCFMFWASRIEVRVCAPPEVPSAAARTATSATSLTERTFWGTMISPRGPGRKNCTTRCRAGVPAPVSPLLLLRRLRGLQLLIRAILAGPRDELQLAPVHLFLE